MPVLRLEQATKAYPWEGNQIVVADNINLEIKQGEFVFITGSSGSGKSTLLQLITGEIQPDRGAAYLDEQNLQQIARRNQPYLRRVFGRVWQESRLIRKRTIRENLLMAVNRQGLKRGERPETLVSKALGLVGITAVEDRYPVELSGGECRRVELARAMVNSPHILVLDELTANLDEDNIWDIMYLLGELNRQGTTIVMATHASQFVNIMRRRVVTLVNGRVLGDVEKGRYGDIV